MIREIIAELQADETGELANELIYALFPNGIRVEVSDASSYYYGEDTRVRVEVGLGPLIDYDSATLS